MTDKIIEHKPLLAYERHMTKFMNTEFYIDQRVYVPNPETELMVEYAIKYISEHNLTNGLFIDVGTGCGNIAITLAKHFPSTRIIATDVSTDALEVAKINVVRHNIQNIQFVNTDLVADISVEPDLIIGNLPWGDDDHLLQTNTKEELAHMPPIAIFAPDGIIGTYVRLCDQIRNKKWNSVLVIETGVLTEETVQQNMPVDYEWDYIKLPSEVFNYTVLNVRFGNKRVNQLVHHHLIYQATVNRPDLSENSGAELVKFLTDIVSLIEMQILIPPHVAYSNQKAWTGIVGIVTSHISFHYWTKEKHLQLDIYSCKKFDVAKVIVFLDTYWKSKNTKVLFIEREVEQDFKVTKF